MTCVQQPSAVRLATDNFVFILFYSAFACTWFLLHTGCVSLALLHAVQPVLIGFSELCVCCASGVVHLSGGLSQYFIFTFPSECPKGAAQLVCR